MEKVVLITGSTRGIGRAIAEQFAREKYLVVLNSRAASIESEQTISFLKKITSSIEYIPADVSAYEEVVMMVERIIKKRKRIDILINNAGIVSDKTIQNMTIPQWQDVLATNLSGAFYCIKAVTPYMKRQKKGSIINITSVIAETGNIGQANYAAAKAGMIGLTKTAAKELAKDNILVNAIAPGFIETSMVKGVPSEVLKTIISMIPVKRLGKPEEVASLAVFLASDKARYITGQVFHINGGLYM